MNASLCLRLLTSEDLSFADLVRALAGWNQTIADWERFLATEPDGCFLAEWNGVSAGTATTIVYGPALAWIGMVLVHPDYRRRGIGGALLERCIEHLRERGVRCIKLNATPAGKKVYDGLGFKDEWTLTRWEHAATHWPKAETIPGIQNCRDVGAVESLDAAAFGVSRRRILELLMKQSRCALVYETETGNGRKATPSPRSEARGEGWGGLLSQPAAPSEQVTSSPPPSPPLREGGGVRCMCRVAPTCKVASYGLLRDGSSALYLGPVVAAAADAGVRLVNTLLARAGERKIYWDIPDQNVAAVELAKKLVFTPQRTLTRMYLGENAAPGDPLQQFAIAAPELG